MKTWRHMKHCPGSPIKQYQVKGKVHKETTYYRFCSKHRLPERIQYEYNIEVTYKNHKHLMFELQDRINLGKTSNV